MKKNNVIRVDFGNEKEVLNIVTSPKMLDVAVAFVYDAKEKDLVIYLLQHDGSNYRETAILQRYKVANKRIAQSYADEIPQMSAIELMIMHLNSVNKK